ncbi:hypothetical protein DPMN_108582 [Dreissena polymorpha]|uniref:Uncharacterized protein n=1 Tax=Dreissena polymorpha TaxID=45954 RepID=A0A9D4K972_DREPO|nr:hypothetical protein DPMN_108582 [Dreissena polymorpha]
MVHNGPLVIAKDQLLPKTASLLPLQSLGRSDFSQKLESSLIPEYLKKKLMDVPG